VRTRRFEHEWILGILAHKPGFATRRMFGGLAAYRHGCERSALRHRAEAAAQVRCISPSIGMS
jgi:hypothetical protein